jgi:hypothetical protein
MSKIRQRVARGAGYAALAAVLSGVGAGAVAAAVDCTADVKAQMRSDEVYDAYVDKAFLVQISSPASCGKVYFDLITTERLFNGEEITTSQRSWRKVTAGGESASRLKYRLAKDSTLLQWEVKFVRCVVCGTE